jgi:sugar lactone lactonase YvrE
MYTLIVVSEASSSSPWEWVFTMQEVESGRGMNLPTAIYADDDASRYYIVDSGNNRLLSYDSNGGFLSAFTANSSLETPFDMIRLPGYLWVVEKGKNSLTAIDLKGQKITPHVIRHNGKDIFPDRLAIDNNVFYLLDKASGDIVSLDRKLNIKETFACGDCNAGFVDFKIKDGKLWALDQIGKSVYVYSLSGKREKKISLKGYDLQFPRSLAIVENGYIYVLDRHRGIIAAYNSSGHYMFNFLEKGESRGKLYYPIEIQIDPWGRLCVVEEGNGRIQVFSRR